MTGELDLTFSLGVAFILGFVAKQMSLPPLVGFLIAGFALHGLDFESNDVIDKLADLGVTILLFTIGLKLKVQTLIKPEVWVGASTHMLITTIVFGLLFWAMSFSGLALFSELDWATAALVAFALSFSSTVFAVKVLDDRGETASLHGKTAIGILVMQDVFAVLFLTISSGKLPSIWALALFGLILLRPVFSYILDKAGHGELIPLFGLFSALALGVALFDMVGLKPDLGALILGMLLADNNRAREIADTLFGFKEILLVAFFLNIGLSGAPSAEKLLLAVMLVPLIAIKIPLFFWLLCQFKLRARSALLSSFSLANYSEFGLIVGAVGVTNGWISADWLVVMAIALSLSFVLAAPLNIGAHAIYGRSDSWLKRFERRERRPDDMPLRPGSAKVLIFGMGRIGTGAYDYIREHYGDVVVGVEISGSRVATHVGAGRIVVHGDATDSDFWERARGGPNKIAVMLLAMPEHEANMNTLHRIQASPYRGVIAAIAGHPDEANALIKAGAKFAFDTRAEAGAGFAAHIAEQVDVLGDPKPVAAE